MITFLVVAFAIALGSSPIAAAASTYYVSPSGVDSLSLSGSAPGSLSFAISHAPAESLVILKNGNYVSGPGGFTVSVSDVTFEAQRWHGSSITNPVSDSLWSAAPGSSRDICLGIVFGPCAHPDAGGWSGGGGTDWRYQDCAFIQNDGFGFGDNSLVVHCLFTDAWFNAFDIGSKNFLMKNTIVRRSNRTNADSDSVGNKESSADNLVFDGVIDYDNEGPGMWFDTANRDWIVKNCTFFANHGGANWYTLGVSSGLSTTQFTGTGQDGAGVSVGSRLLLLHSSQANRGQQVVVTAVTGYNPMTITINTPLPLIPEQGDQFAVLQSGSGDSGGTGLISEANANGSFIDNVTYNNTDSGFADNDSGGGYGVTKPGVTITGNQFNYDGIGFRGIDGGPNNPTRKLGKATVENNVFRVGNLTNKYAFKVEGTNGSFGFPGPYDGLAFDHNTYIPDANYKGPWATWYIWTNYPKPGWYSTSYTASSLSDLQNPLTFDQDHNSIVAASPFRGKTVDAFIWPVDGDIDWNDIYCPNNVYGTTHSIHQVNDDETPYIEQQTAQRTAGSTITLTVFGHTAFTGAGPYMCDVYDYSGRFVTLKLKSVHDRDLLDRQVPGFAVLIPSKINVRLETSPKSSIYNLVASFPAR